MLTGSAFVAAFVTIVALMIVAISIFRIHPFLAILGAAGILGFLCLDLNTTLDVILQGFSGVFITVGLIVILGTLSGLILEHTGAALKMSEVVVKIFGPKHPNASLVVMGWISSISIYCDSGFIILNPVRKAIVKRLQTSSVATTVALANGLFLSHCLIPPASGPIAAAGALNIENNLILVIAFGLLASIPSLFVICFFSRFIGKRVKDINERDLSEKAFVQTYEELLASYGQLPNAFLSFLPIFLPIALMGASSFSAMLGIDSPFLVFLGRPVIALAIGFFSSLILLHKSGKSKDLYNLTSNALTTVGPILFITGSGSALGKIIGESPLIPFFAEHSGTLSSMGVFFPFLFAALLKTSQGSSTVALTTTASVVAPMLEQLGLDTPAQTALAVTAIGSGALTLSHVNDSYFWIVLKFGELSNTLDCYRSHVLCSALIGVTSILTTFVISLFL